MTLLAITKHKENVYLVLCVISLLCWGLQTPLLQEWAVWDNRAITQGDWWRILSGNFTHTNYPHLVMNLAALWILAHLFQPSSLQLVYVILVSSFVIGCSLLFTSTFQYAGFSGVLHAIFAYFALREALSGRHTSWLLCLGVVIKVAWEHYFGAAESTMVMINARVAIEAHLTGMVSGFLLIGVELLFKKEQ